MLAALFAAFTAVAAQDKGWRPITPAELELKSPKVEAGSDAEAIFWDVRVDDELGSGFHTTLDHYLRIKIFTDRGRDEYAKVDIPYGKFPLSEVDISIRDIVARTIKPDGTIVNVAPADIFDQEIVKGRGLRYKSRSFVFPGVTAGSIIEYRWREIRRNTLSFYVRLMLAREIPVQSVKYYIRPATLRLGMRVHSINTTSGFVKENNGFYSTSMENVPAFREEPFMPTEYEVRPWVLVYYEGQGRLGGTDEYWRALGKRLYELYKEELEPNDKVKQVAAQAIGTPTETIEDVRRIYQYCRDKIVNTDDDASGLTAEQRKKLKPNRNASDVLERGTGTSRDIRMLFGAMAAAAGFDVRVARVSLRTDARFQKSEANSYFIRSGAVAVKIDNEWLFFDPANRYVPFGSLAWSQEGETVLVADPNYPFFATTPFTSPDKSKQTRTATLRLSDDGSVEGDVRIEYTGHLGGRFKEAYDCCTPAEHEKAVIAMVKAQMSDRAEVTAVSIENAKDPEKPLTYSFRIRLPSYAEKTGTRVHFVPNIFERSSSPRFTKSDRRYPVAFDYAWSEDDTITFNLPDGYTAESVEAPPRVLDRNGSQDIRLELARDGRSLTYKRSMSFGARGELVFYQTRYAEIKGLFDSFHTANKHAVILRKDSKIKDAP